MKEYFKLQYRLNSRKLTDFGLKPFIACIFLLIVFIALSMYLFTKTEYAEYMYVFIALSFVITLSETKRNDFLKLCFSKNDYFKTRIIENIIVAFPFALFLIYKSSIISPIILITVSVLFAFINFKPTYNVIIPTPFSKKPFEFLAGFRNTFILFGFAYCLTFIAIAVNNFKLGLSTVLFVLLIISSFYAKPEHEYFVWSYNLTAKQFLKEKFKTALLYSSYLGLPIFIALGIFFFDHIQMILLFILFYYLYLITIILAKYATYPLEINLPQFLLLAACFIFPPALILIIPYFFNQSLNRLKHILE